MKLVINGRFLLQHVTGVQKVGIEFLRALDELLSDGMYPGLEVDLVAPRRGTLITNPVFENFKLRRRGLLPGHLWEQIELPSIAGKNSLLCLGNMAPLRSLLMRSRRVYTMVHDLSYKYYPQAYSRQFKIVYNLILPVVLARSTCVFTVSKSEVNAILARYGHLIDPTRLIPVQNGGGSDGELRPRGDYANGEAADPPKVATRDARIERCLYVGSLTKRKNAKGLGLAAIELTRSGEMEFVFIGSTQAGLADAGLEIPSDLLGKIRFLGQIDDPRRIEAEYEKASLLLFPSFYEASPLPPIEAMSFGCPVVCADIPSLRERCGDAAIYCDPHDVNSMVSQARLVLRDRILWDELQSKGLSHARNYTWRSQARTVLSQIGGLE
jgi:glycosyltransferase involved in cell wall biosynthesis